MNAATALLIQTQTNANDFYPVLDGWRATELTTRLHHIVTDEKPLTIVICAFMDLQNNLYLGKIYYEVLKQFCYKFLTAFILCLKLIN